nr:hypothetical protein [uncultured Anaerostipes sp.]
MIAEAIKQAQQIHRTVIEQTYDGTCNIYSMQDVKDPETKITEQKEVSLLENVPCHMSFSGAVTAEGNGTSTDVKQEIKLFLAPEVLVPPGCRIEVMQHGVTESYSGSGKAAIYSSHQEISLELWKEYA